MKHLQLTAKIYEKVIDNYNGKEIKGADHIMEKQPSFLDILKSTMERHPGSGQ